MITLSYYLDVRYVQKDSGRSALKLRVASGKSKSYLPLGCKFCFTPEEWSQSDQILTKGCKNRKALNEELGMMLASFKQKVFVKWSVYATVNPADVVYYLANGEEKKNEKDTAKGVLAVFDRYAKIKEDKPKSAESFRYTALRIKNFSTDAESLEWEDIDLEWLKQFEHWLLKGDKNNKPLSINTTAIHLENLRAVMNFAIDEEITDKYPFKRFEIKRQRVIKPIMEQPDLIKLFSLKGQTEQEDYYLDIYRLIFTLCGINIIDLYNAKDADVISGRLEFDRHKTGVHVSIKLEPEALAIIEKHKGKDGYLVDLANRYATSQNFDSQINKRLKQIGRWHMEGHTKVMDEVYWPCASTYTARRSWATLAGAEDFSFDTIGMGLGHRNSSVTAIYVRPFLKKLDKANRRLLDIVTGKSEPTPDE